VIACAATSPGFGAKSRTRSPLDDYTALSAANARMTGTSDIREINVLGDLAYVRNHIDITITPPGRNVMRHSGYTLSILRKQSNGKWVLWSLIA
jgi:ketosteroid isomerase-like protein